MNSPFPKVAPYTNTQRVSDFTSLIRPLTKATRDPEELKAIATDVLTNMRHWVAAMLAQGRVDFTFEDLIRISEDHFNVEVADEHSTAS